MNVRKLYQNSFGDSDRFTDYYFLEHGGFPVTIEENGETVCMCMVTPRLLNAAAAGEFGYQVAYTALIGGVCTGANFRQKGYATKLMRKTLDVCKSLGYVSAHLTPIKGLAGFYEKFGFETVDAYREGVVAEADVPSYYLDRVSIDSDTQLLSVVRLMELQSCRCAALHFDYQDAKRLIKQADTMGGMYLIYNLDAAVGFTMVDTEELRLPLTVLPEKQDAGFVLSHAVDKTGAFSLVGYRYDAEASQLLPDAIPRTMRVALAPRKNQSGRNFFVHYIYEHY